MTDALATALRLGNEDDAVRLLGQATDGIVCLCRRKLGATGFRTLITALVEDASVTSVGLENTGIGAEDAVALLSALQLRDVGTRSVHLSCNALGDGGASAVAAVLARNTRTVDALFLDANGIGDVGASALSAALKRNTSLRTLSLVDNRVSTLGAVALHACLELNTSLTAVELTRNRCMRHLRGVAAVHAVKRETEVRMCECMNSSSSYAQCMCE